MSHLHVTGNELTLFASGVVLVGALLSYRAARLASTEALNVQRDLSNTGFEVQRELAAAERLFHARLPFYQTVLNELTCFTIIMSLYKTNPSVKLAITETYGHTKKVLVFVDQIRLLGSDKLQSQYHVYADHLGQLLTALHEVSGKIEEHINGGGTIASWDESHPELLGLIGTAVDHCAKLHRALIATIRSDIQRGDQAQTKAS